MNKSLGVISGIQNNIIANGNSHTTWQQYHDLATVPRPQWQQYYCLAIVPRFDNSTHDLATVQLPGNSTTIWQQYPDLTTVLLPGNSTTTWHSTTTWQQYHYLAHYLAKSTTAWPTAWQQYHYLAHCYQGCYMTTVPLLAGKHTNAWQQYHCLATVPLYGNSMTTYQ